MPLGRYLQQINSKESFYVVDISIEDIRWIQVENLLHEKRTIAGVETNKGTLGCLWLAVGGAMVATACKLIESFSGK